MSLPAQHAAVQAFTETDLKRNGIVRLSLPLPYKPGTVNAYLLTGPPPVLIDTGLNDRISLKSLWEVLNSEGIQPHEIEHVFLTHGHIDHAGAAAFLAQNYQTKIWVHELEKSRFNGRYAHFLTTMLPDIYRRLGADQEALNNLKKTIQSSLKNYYRMRHNSFRFFKHEQKLPVADYDLSVLYTPGHSPGSVCFIEKKQKVIFTGDTLLSEGTPRPTLSLDALGGPYFNGLIELKKSLALLTAAEAETVLPGHGYPANRTGLILKAKMTLKRKQALLLRKLGSDFTPYDLIRRRDKRTKGAYLFIDLYQTRTILQALLAEGKVNMRIRAGVEYFQLA